MTIRQVRDPLYQIECDLCKENAHEGESVPMGWSNITIQIRGYQQTFHACNVCTRNGPRLPGKKQLFELMGLPVDDA